MAISCSGYTPDLFFVKVEHSQFVSCVLGISATAFGSGSGTYSGVVLFNNCLLAAVNYPVDFSGGSGGEGDGGDGGGEGTWLSLTMTHCTIANAAALKGPTANDSTVAISSYNSIFANVNSLSVDHYGYTTIAGDYNGFYASPNYIFANCTANGNITVAAGTAIGWSRSAPDVNAINAGAAAVNFNGTQASPDYWVRINTVQERDLSGPGSGSGLYTSSGQINGWFTRFAEMAGDQQAISGDGQYILNATHCEFLGGALGGRDSLAMAFSNCLFDRCPISKNCSGRPPLSCVGDVVLRNCTARGGQLQMLFGVPEWHASVRDCAFDGTAFDLEPDGSSQFDFAYNAFSGSDPSPTGQGANDLPNVSFNWQTGPRGEFYGPNNSPLIDAGDVTPDVPGLLDFTTRIDQTPELDEFPNKVNIGYHYFSTVDPVAGPDGDADGDGLSNLTEYQQSSSPVENDGLANALALPPVHARYLRIITPTLLELVRIESDNSWVNFESTPPSAGNLTVTADGSSIAVQRVGFKRHPLYNSYPDTSDLRIENDLYLALASPIPDNALVVVNNSASYWPSYMQFTAHNDPLRYGSAIHVNQDGYVANKSGVLSANSKKAKIGYYLGGLGEMQLSGSIGFDICDAVSGTPVWSSTAQNPAVYLTAKPDTGWNTGQEQYQHVLEADFTSFTTPGMYRLKVPGLGASFPFAVNDSSPLKWARSYALGLYHQRCGAANVLPFTRFTHDACHTPDAFIPSTPSYPDPTSIQFQNSHLACDNNPKCTAGTACGITWSDPCESGFNPDQTASYLCSFESSIFPFQNTLTKSVSGGHHDAGDYSKYVINSGLFIHTLVFAADNFPGVAGLDSLGLPESGDGKSDVLQLAKWEADFLVKMKDADGGFYFLVYPTGCSLYESATPDRAPRQLLYPKTSSVTATAVGALADIASSPAFRAAYPSEAANYMASAVAGWNFLVNAIDARGKPNIYQKITTYGDDWTDRDELLWAAAAMFAAGYATGPGHPDTHPQHDPHTLFIAWLAAENPIPQYQGYWRLFAGWGCAARDYAFAIESGRVSARTVDVDASGTRVTLVSGPNFDTSWTGNVKINGTSYAISGSVTATMITLSSSAGPQTGAKFTKDGDMTGLDTTSFARCQTEIRAAGADWAGWSQSTSYGTSMPDAAKRYYAIGWYFSASKAFEIAVAYAMEPSTHPDYVRAMLENFNYQHGCNPINQPFVTGSGYRRQRTIVNQYHEFQNYDKRFFAPSGLIVGNIADSFQYGDSTLNNLAYPAPAGGGSSYALYDRWDDTHNLETEFVSLESTRALVTAAYLHNIAGAADAHPGWKSASDSSFSFPNGNPALNSPTVVRLDTTDSTIDLNQALIVWDCEFEDQPAFGRTFTLKPRTTVGETLVEAEAVLPDGRRVFGQQYVNFYNPDPNGPGESQNDDSTVALYHFSEMPTPSLLYPPAADSGSHGYGMQPSGLATRSPNAAWMGSPSGFSAKFAGAGDRLQTASIADSVLRSSGKWTIEARIYVKGYVPNANPTIFTLSQYVSGDNYNANWTLYFDTPTAPQFYGPQGQRLIDAAHWASYVTPNTWHALKVTIDNGGTTTRIYIDGQEVLNSPFTTNPGIGTGSSWTLSMGDFIGDIDEVRISSSIR